MTRDTWEVPAGALVLVACSGSKLDAPAPARQLYTGELFRASVAWTESWRLPWRILSALHGIVGPDDVIAPYDAHLDVIAEADYAALRSDVADHLAHAGVDAVVVLGGVAYVELVRAALPADVELWAPLQELPARGLGHYKRWLLGNTATAVLAQEWNR